MGSISTFIGSRWGQVTMGGVALAAVTAAVAVPVIDGGAPSITCNQAAANSSALSTAVGSASSGSPSTICLTAATTYTIPDTTKPITFISQSGTGAKNPVNNSVSLDIRSNDANWTLDGGMTALDEDAAGLTITGALIRDSPSNITIKNFKSTGCGSKASPTHGCRLWTLDPAPLNSNILIERGVFHDIYSGEAIIYIDDNPTAGCGDTGVTVRDSFFVDFVNDGVKLTGCDTAHIVDNKMLRFECTHPNSGWTADDCGADGTETPGTNHTDGIQYIADFHDIRGNWLRDGEQCIFGDDDSGGNTIEGNVVDNCVSHWITIAADSPTSTVKNNTVAQTTGVFTPPQIDCGGTDSGTPASTTIITDNVAQRVSTAGSPTCVPTTNARNMCISSCGAGNFTGTADYVGYNDHATIADFDSFSDFCLEPTSPGYTSGAGGSQVGVCGPSYGVTYDGPPAVVDRGL